MPEALDVKDTPTPDRFLGLATVFDLEGFTDFCTRPQVEQQIPAFLNHVFGHVCSSLDVRWSPGDPFRFKFDEGSPPLHLKFLGDGALVIWALPDEVEDRKRFFTQLLHRLYIARKSFSEVVDDCRDEFGLVDLPDKLRFGIATGEILRLSMRHGDDEYVGFPINLASRLQGYCRDLGFIASARIGIPLEVLEEQDLCKVHGLKLRGFSTEVLIVDQADFLALPQDIREALFEEI